MEVNLLMEIKNVTSRKLDLNDIPDSKAAGGSKQLQAGATGIYFDEDCEKSEALKKFMLAGSIIKLSDKEPNDDQPNHDPVPTFSGTVVGGSSIIYMGRATNGGVSSNLYFSPAGANLGYNLDDGSGLGSAGYEQMILPKGGTAKNLYVRLPKNQTNGTSTIMLAVNGVDTALVATSHALDTVCFNDVDEVVIPAGSIVSMKYNVGTSTEDRNVYGGSLVMIASFEFVFA